MTGKTALGQWCQLQRRSGAVPRSVWECLQLAERQGDEAIGFASFLSLSLPGTFYVKVCFYFVALPLLSFSMKVSHFQLKSAHSFQPRNFIESQIFHFYINSLSLSLSLSLLDLFLWAIKRNSYHPTVAMTSEFQLIDVGRMSVASSTFERSRDSCKTVISLANEIDAGFHVSNFT